MSLVPNSDTMKSLDPGGAKSMTADPTAAIGEGTPAIRPANSSPTPSAASAATMPEIAASPRGTVPGARGDGVSARSGWTILTGVTSLMRPVSRLRVTFP